MRGMIAGNKVSIKRAAITIIMITLVSLIGCQFQRSPDAVLINTGSDQNIADVPVITLGIIYPFAHPFYEEITRLAEEAAQPYSVRLIIKAPEGIHAEQQIHMMETLIRQQVDAIAIAPVDSEALLPVIDKAMSAGIPVICFESDSPDSQRLAYIGPDHTQAGMAMGQLIQKLQKDKGMVLVQTGPISMTSHTERLNGLLHYLKNKTHVQVLEVRNHQGSSDRALADLEEMIDDHPHFDTLISVDLVSSSTSILVWKAKGLDRYALSFYMTPEIKEAMLNGQITSVISQNEQNWGQLLIDNLLKAARNEKIPAFINTGIEELK